MDHLLPATGEIVGDEYLYQFSGDEDDRLRQEYEFVQSSIT